jgi:predicted GNAT family N-acyltransferase
MSSNAFRIMRVQWHEHGALCASVREKVFVYEMRFSPYADQDGRDGHCQHVLAISAEGDAIGTGRVEADGRISRIAVLMPWRQSGVGSAVLNELISLGRDRGLDQVSLSAPMFAFDFYRSNQFEPVGSVYMEEGIPHQKMTLRLAQDPFFSSGFDTGLAHAS